MYKIKFLNFIINMNINQIRLSKNIIIKFKQIINTKII